MNPLKAILRKFFPEKILQLWRRLRGMEVPLEQALAATKLHLGCGANILDGWLNSDLMRTRSIPPGAHEKIKNIFIMDATASFVFRDEQFDFIYCEDFIEHFDQLQGLCICTECYRVLKPGGVWRISTPDFDDILMYMRPRKRDDIEFKAWSWDHKLLYTKEYLKSVLENCGFSEVRFCAYGESAFDELKGIDTRIEQRDINLIVDAIK